MNEKCAAGTGRFLEVMARVLQCRLEDLSPLAKRSTKDLSISSTCTVFAESEVISQLAGGASRADVARGAHRSIAKRVSGLCNRMGLNGTVAMSGGVALNEDVVAALGDELRTKVIAVENPQIVGALGAALFAYEKCH
jgi:predicted CoA-substrate-specific enzyme activase